MENTLALMNSKNEGYRKSLTKVDQSSMPLDLMTHVSCTGRLSSIDITIIVSGEEIGQLETLDGQWRAALDKHKHRKRHVKQLEDDLKVHGRVHPVTIVLYYYNIIICTRS